MFISENKRHQMKNQTVCLKLINIVDKDSNLISSSSIIFKAHTWTKVIEIKTRIAKEYKIKNSLIRLFLKNTEMINNLNILDYHLIENQETILYYKLEQIHKNSLNLSTIDIYAAFPSDKKLLKVIQDIRLGFLKSFKPQPTVDGTSGTYFMKNFNGEIIAVFKPIDEEAFTPNNLKGYPGKFGQEGFRKGILSGEGNIREVAASVLDMANKKIFRVPETTFVEMTHKAFNFTDLNLNANVQIEAIGKIKNSIIHNYVLENVLPGTGVDLKSLKSFGFSDLNEGDFQKIDDEENLSILNEKNKFPDDLCFTKKTYSVKKEDDFNSLPLKKKYGSLQKFVHNAEVAVNFSSDLFSTEEVHKIAILDLRILNCDRNDENILVIKKKNKSGQKEYKLIPIDHSLTFPDCIEIYEYEMCWTGWKQSKEPFSQKMLEYINSIDITGDMKKISETVKMRPICLRNYRIANITLQLGVQFNLNLYEIAMLIYRKGYDEVPSIVEKIVEECKSLATFYQDSKFFILVRERLNLSTKETFIFDHQAIHSITKKKKYSINKKEKENSISTNYTYDTKRKRTQSEPKTILPDFIEDKKNDSIVESETVKLKNKFSYENDIDSQYNNIIFYEFSKKLKEFLQEKYNKK